MVSLSRIYTKTGDQGTTRLGDNSEVAKTDIRIEAVGAVDEVNALLGLVPTSAAEGSGNALLQAVQNDLFDLGADLCRPLAAEEEETALRIQPQQVERLEAEIDRINQGLDPLRSFVLPGGAPVAAYLHLARSICRRAERRAWTLVETAGEESVNPQVLAYLNRLSDLLFVLSRVDNLRQGMGDVLWQPGGESD